MKLVIIVNSNRVLNRVTEYLRSEFLNLKNKKYLIPYIFVVDMEQRVRGVWIEGRNIWNLGRRSVKPKLVEYLCLRSILSLT